MPKAPQIISYTTLHRYPASTHDQSHPSTLYYPHQEQHPAQYLPPAFPLLLSAPQNHNVRYQRYTLTDYRK